MDDGANDGLPQVSADLPFELRSKLFEQLATMGVAGAGLVVTLRGSLLADASPMIWLGAIEFTLAAVLALAAQVGLIEGLFVGTASPRTGRILSMAAIVLLGMGIGTAAMSVFMEGDRGHVVAKAR